MRKDLSLSLGVSISLLVAALGCQAPPRAAVHPRFAELAVLEISIAPVKNATLADLSKVPSGGLLQQSTIGTATVDVPKEVEAELHTVVARRGYRVASTGSVRLSCEIHRFQKTLGGGDSAVEIQLSVALTKTDGSAVTDLYRCAASQSQRSLGAPTAYDIAHAARQAAANALAELPHRKSLRP